MKLDRYSKLILTVIALMLTVIACKSVIQPGSVAAQGPLAGVQFIGTGNGIYVLDTKQGDLWMYSAVINPRTGKEGLGAVQWLGRMKKAGDPLVQVRSE